MTSESTFFSLSFPPFIGCHLLPVHRSVSTDFSVARSSPQVDSPSLLWLGVGDAGSHGQGFLHRSSQLGAESPLLLSGAMLPLLQSPSKHRPAGTEPAWLRGASGGDCRWSLRTRPLGDPWLPLRVQVPGSRQLEGWLWSPVCSRRKPASLLRAPLLLAPRLGPICSSVLHWGISQCPGMALCIGAPHT